MDLEIKHELIRKCTDYGILNKKAKFLCYTDNMFTYGIKNIYEFTFICDDTLLQDMEVEELIMLRNIRYFEITKNIGYSKETMTYSKTDGKNNF